MFIVVILLKAKSSKKVCPVPVGLLSVNNFWCEYFVFASRNNILIIISSLFVRYKLFNEQLTRTIRYYSKTWRMWAAVAIQLAWRRFKARRSRVYSGPLNFARVSSSHDGDPELNVDQRDRLRMFTAMIVCPKPRSWGKGAKPRTQTQKFFLPLIPSE